MDISYCSPRRRRSCTAEACINGLDPVPHSCILSLASAIRSAAAVDWSCAGTKSRCNSSSGDRLGGSIESTPPSSRDQFQCGYRGETLRWWWKSFYTVEGEKQGSKGTFYVMVLRLEEENVLHRL
ncbi:uncharacterized protein LOC112190271 isoform X2 [Rosa chinensis]|uniref:uncharacterized protein LOC112190271 isoform X2 n=1 Tax=Rosa chinensis TaxID=74649 RepID=UPI001AD8BFE7|nr:uncharacterized protein LOC112190271 isoform X2 [Rosa chinensis]